MIAFMRMILMTHGFYFDFYTVRAYAGSITMLYPRNFLMLYAGGVPRGSGAFLCVSL